MEPRHLVLPMFVADGIAESAPILSMPGVVQHTRDSLRRAAADAVATGIGGLMLFGVPCDEDKDPTGSVGVDPDGILNVALRDLAADLGDATVLMADTCLDEFTDHGHCGVLDAAGRVDNDQTNRRYVELAVAQANSGAHVVGPSGMMDGQVAAIRDGLDAAGYSDTAILAYAAKFASGFYGPFREAVASSLQGDRRTYQQDPGNAREALHEVELDIEEGADIVMVKPAMSYLDVVRAVVDTLTADEEFRKSLPLGIDAADRDEMASTASKVMAQLADTVRDRVADLSDKAAAHLSDRHAERTRPVAVRPLATLDAMAAAGSLPVRWRHGLIGTLEHLGEQVHLRLPDRAITFPKSCATPLEALQRGLVADAESLPGLDHADSEVLIRRLLREAVVVSAGDGTAQG
mgnify:CR=1 FL=1